VTHNACSADWFGAVGVFLALAVIALTSPDAPTVRGAYLVMAPAARHYWVVFKLLITTVRAAVLLIYMTTFRFLATVAASPGVDLATVRNPSPALHATLALLLLITACVLAVYKPRGTTRYGQRRQHRHRTEPAGKGLGRRGLWHRR
jgi:hypothetical protein